MLKFRNNKNTKICKKYNQNKKRQNALLKKKKKNNKNFIAIRN